MGVFIPRPVRDWRDAVMTYDLGRGTEPRRFLSLRLDEQAFVVARIAWREYSAPKLVH